jgi:hypothetical protein
LPKTRFVYARVDVLWRTVQALRAAGRIDSPGGRRCAAGVRALVEAAYNDDEVPIAIRDAAIRAEGAERAAASLANFSILTLPDGYNGHARGWVDDMRVPTRLGAPETTLRLAHAGSDGDLAPWATVRDAPRKTWALSEVRVSMRRVPPTAAPLPMYRAAADAARAGWSTFERDLPILPLVAVGPNMWEGTLLIPDRETPLRLRYSPTDGLSFL